MSKTHPLAGKSSVSLDELSGDRFIGMEMDEGRSKLVSSILPLYARHGIDLSQFIIAKDFVEIGLIIRQTGAVCVLMDSLGTLGRDYLTSVPLSDDGSTLSLYLFRRKDDEDENVNAFFDLAPFIKR